MKKKIKYIIIALVGVSSFTSLLLFNFLILPNLNPNSNLINNNNREKQFNVQNITVYLDYSGVKDNEIFLNLNLSNYETTAYHALLNCCNITIKEYGWGRFVQYINGVGVGWIYWINNDPPPTMPADYSYLMDNDTVSWKYVS